MMLTMEHKCEPDPLDLHGACLTCKNATLKFSKLPCLRYKITDVKMFYTTPAPGRKFSERWSWAKAENLTTWDLNSSVDVIQMTQDFVAKPLTLRVRRFVPIEGDVLHRQWFDKKLNKKKMVNIPPYALVDLVEVEKEYFDHVNEGGAEFFYGILDANDTFLRSTYSMAIARANDVHTVRSLSPFSPGFLWLNHRQPEEERKVLKLVLRLWFTVRMMSRSEHIVGNNTLGMPMDLIDDSSPLHGKIPIPPVMADQLAAIIIQKLQIPLRKKVLEGLQTLIQAKTNNSWFTIYLCIFMLLHNCSLLTQFEEMYARKHGRPVGDALLLSIVEF